VCASSQFPLGCVCVCLITTTRPGSAGPSYFGRQGKAIEKPARSRPTAPAPFNEDVPPILHSNPQGCRTVWASLLSRTAYLLRISPSYHRLAAPSHTSSPPHLDNSRPDRAAHPSAVRKHRRRSPPPIVFASTPLQPPSISALRPHAP
jgi:hypothetical protein